MDLHLPHISEEDAQRAADSLRAFVDASSKVLPVLAQGAPLIATAIRIVKELVEGHAEPPPATTEERLARVEAQLTSCMTLLSGIAVELQRVRADLRPMKEVPC